jgi:formate dehydrogenase major subunit
MYRKPGANKFERVSWDFAMDRIAKLMKEDRDQNFIVTNKDGVTVNRWTTMAFLSGSSCTNETGWVTWKVTRALGMLQLENQARI